MSSIKREFYDVEEASNMLGISVTDLWHLIEVEEIGVSFRRVIAEVTFGNEELPSMLVGHTYLMSKGDACVVAAKGSCLVKYAYLPLVEPKEGSVLEMHGNGEEVIDFFDTTEMYLNKEIEIQKSDVVITQISLDKYLEKNHNHNEPFAPNLKSESKPLVNKERETLLVIIAALAKAAHVDINKISKAGDVIANMTHEIGVPIGATTIETHLKKIKQALEDLAK